MAWRTGSRFAVAGIEMLAVEAVYGLIAIRCWSPKHVNVN